MKQREVQDSDNVKWVCVQALSGVSRDISDLTEEKIENGKGEVEVVCTPSGGAQTKRIHLPKEWNESLSDEQLVAAISRQ